MNKQKWYIYVIGLLLAFIFLLIVALDKAHGEVNNQKKLNADMLEQKDHYEESLSVMTLSMQLICEQVDCNELILDGQKKYEGKPFTPKKMKFLYEYK